MKRQSKCNIPPQSPYEIAHQDTSQYPPQKNTFPLRIQALSSHNTTVSNKKRKWPPYSVTSSIIYIK